MLGLKKFLRENKKTIIISIIILICSIAIAFGVYEQITTQSETEKQDNNYADLKSNFKDIFTNTINKEVTAKMNINYEELIYCEYNLADKKEGKYNINAKIPAFKGESDTIKKINSQIYNTFSKEIIAFVKNEDKNVSYNLDYVAYVNNNIISLVIMCKYKNGSTPQKVMIETYNYDIENDKLLEIEDVINYKKLNKEEMQKKVKEEIKKENKQMKSIAEQGYNIYIRNEELDVYEIENTPNFFLGKNNYLYLVYAYGNNEYTSEYDLVIF